MNLLGLILSGFVLNAQTNPAILNWLQNTTITGRHYVKNNSTPIVDAALANCQSIKYSAASVYVATNGIPTYITGPFQDGNPSLATAQNAIFKLPLNPAENTGTKTNTNGGNIGLFINILVFYFTFLVNMFWSKGFNSKINR